MFRFRRLAIFFCIGLKTVFPLMLSEFYSFGKENGDKSIPRVDDGNSGRITLSKNVQFLGKSSSSLFVSIPVMISCLKSELSFGNFRNIANVLFIVNHSDITAKK